ncbi:uncharacterized protein LOC124407910 [Diprion similis]|uniref:uncharacterized protein LOC124407910 n=1 Tax=Diprion similis TaxID=362088 RepID=UPI001EF907F7|nr:uncharacterized protein LOC124407910 [Diprion similis]
MKTIALVLLIVATASAIEWTDLRVRWLPYAIDPTHNRSMFKMPLTESDAISQSWVEVTGVTSLNLRVYCFEEGDGRVCLEFDSYGNIAAIQAAILRSDVEYVQGTYDRSHLNQYQIKTIFGEEYWTSTVYFVSPDVIAAGGRSETNGYIGTEAIWIGTTDGFIKIVKTVSDWDPAWTKEGCVSEQGTHYQYAMNTSTECTEVQPWFLLEQEGKLSGFGFQGFGNMTYKNRNWYEAIPPILLRDSNPTIPDCVIEWGDEFGFTFMHVLLTSESWKFVCE